MSEILGAADTERLRAFVGWIMTVRDDHDGRVDSIDAADLQEAMVAHGLLRPTEVHAPCNEEGCWCAEYHGEDGFPVTCYQYTDLGKWAMRGWAPS